MSRRSQSGEKRYEGTMDVFERVRHPFLVDSSEDRTWDKRELLSVVVDDNESVRESLPDLLREFGFAVEAFSSAQDFLSSGCVGETSCLILDVAMPGMGGLELQMELKRLGREIPIIFITGRNDEAVRTRALAQGAVGFLLKPFSDAALLEALKTATSELR
jgi:FixJ family two-component response regulator